MTVIEQSLRQRIGLDPASIGRGSIHRAIRLRMKALSVGTPEEYAARLQRSPSEWTELQESVVVTETWFFRDRDPFDAFVQFVRERLAGTDRSQRLRVLSVPCSSGEEPYSLVMALLDAGIAPERFQVDAADISARALLKAKRALYSRNSFRGKDLGFRDRYFQPHKEGYLLCPAVRAAVRFFEANILSASFPSGSAPYDVIFCRNLLIYFDRQTQASALSTVSRLLAPDGLLLVGAAEQPLAFENGFTSANVPLAFACRKANAPAPAPGRHLHPARHLELPPVPVGATATGPSARTAKPGFARDRVASRASLLEKAVFGPEATAASTGAGPHSPLPELTLADAQRLANQGKFTEAAEACERCLRRDATSAQAWYLLGLIRDAVADPLAIECYRKALYLNPRHYETLLQMALLSEKSGDLARARTFRRRAARAKPGTPTEAARV